MSTTTYIRRFKDQQNVDCAIGWGKGEGRPSLRMFISQPAAFSVQNPGGFGPGRPDRREFAIQGREEVGVGD